MARHTDDLAALSRAPHWRAARDDPAQPVWTDDHSSLLSVFRWR
jgi:hypothetical protein